MQIYKALRGILAVVVLFLLWTTPAQPAPQLGDVTLAR